MFRRFAALATVLLLAACAGGPGQGQQARGPTVKFAFDPATDFSHVHSYSWIGKPDGVPELTQQRIVDGVDTRLQTRGWTRVAANGDVHLDAHVSTRDHETPNARSIQVGYTGWGGFGPPPPNSPAATDSVEVGTLVVDMYDGKTRRAMWRGTASGTLDDDPARMSALLQTALDRLFANFPPKK